MTDAADLQFIAWKSFGNTVHGPAFKKLKLWAVAQENVVTKLNNAEFIWSTPDGPERMPTNDEYALVFADLGKRTLSKKRKDHERSDLERYNAIPVMQKHIAEIARVVITSQQVIDSFQEAIDHAQEAMQRELDKDSPNDERVTMFETREAGLQTVFDAFEAESDAYECITQAVLNGDFDAFKDALDEHGMPELEDWSPEDWE